MSEENAVAMIESAPLAISPETVAYVVTTGDLAGLNAVQKAEYYTSVCRSVGLNPLTKPFEFLQLNGKLRLYALRDCTDQLRRLHQISIEITKREKLDDLYIVTAQAKTQDGRIDESTGAVSIKGQSGENLANALMKAETKAKRRVTLSIAGMGWLDESEVETMPQTTRQAVTSGPAKAQESEARARETILGAITASLKEAELEKGAMQQQLFDAFTTAGWSKIKAMPLDELQAGYAKLKFALQQLDTPEFEAPRAVEEIRSPALQDAPGDEAPTEDIPLVGATPEDVTTGQPDPVDDDARASDRMVAELTFLAQKVGPDAQQDLEDMLGGKRRQSFTVANYRTVKSHLQSRQAGQSQATQGALV